MTTPPPSPTPPPDATMPIPSGGEPTMPVPPGGGDPTIPTQGEPYGGGPGGPGGPGEDEYEEGDNRRLWLIAGGILVLGLIIGVIIAVAASGDDDTTTTTTSSSTSTSTSTSTTTLPTTTTAPPTTAAPAPSITQFTVSQNPVSCPGTNQVTLSWVTQNTSGVTLSIDNPNDAFGNYGPTATEQFPFACGNGPGQVEHTYYLRANGTGGQTTQKQVTVTGNFNQGSTTTSTT